MAQLLPKSLGTALVIALSCVTIAGCECSTPAAGNPDASLDSALDRAPFDGTFDAQNDNGAACSLSCPANQVCVVQGGTARCAGPCDSLTCPSNEACGVACVPYHAIGSCRGITCADDQTCFNGRCVAGCFSNRCLDLLSCPEDAVCIPLGAGAACISRATVEQYAGLCPPGTLAQSRCLPTSVCPPCNAGERCQQGQCVVDRCIGVQCQPGEFCYQGMCFDSCECTPFSSPLCRPCPPGTRWNGLTCASLPCERNCPPNNTTAGLADGCGGTCPVQCTPDCPLDGSRTCMDNGCGGSCPCTGGQVCNGSACCTPSCPGDLSRACMDDGCGRSCPCGAGSVCNAGSCCTPDCSGAGRGCQTDGCGGICPCPLGQSCNAARMCTDPPGCPTVCPDGRPPCGCSCCASGEDCSNGSCAPFLG